MNDPRADVEPLIVVERLSKRYGDALALDGVNFSMARGEFVALVGPSGAGKSTLLRLLAALEPPSAGTIRIAGVTVERMNRDARAALRRSIGVMPQQDLLLPDRSALANVMLPALIAGIRKSEAMARARIALQRVGIGSDSPAPARLSAGQQQRIALARALVNQPALLLADAPTAHLDGDSAADILRLLAQFAASGIAVIIASHADRSALPDRARFLRLAAGRLIP